MRKESLVLLGLMFPIHARCFASIDRSKMHLRCDFRYVFRNYLKKVRLSSCVALIANPRRSNKNVINKNLPDKSTERGQVR